VDKLLRTEDLAAMTTDEPPQRWRARRVSGDGPPFVKIGRRAYYLESDVNQWIADRRCTNTAQARAVRIARIEGTSK
jgi:predicted DNA-binding transcriptional regulator AlpA